MGLESGPEVRIRSTVGEISNEYVHDLLYLSLF